MITEAELLRGAGAVYSPQEIRMTNSLVQRLRAQDKHSTHGDQVERDRLFYLAAAEVERLQSLIRRVIEWQPPFPVEASLLDELAEAVGPAAPRIDGGTPPTGVLLGLSDECTCPRRGGWASGCPTHGIDQR